MTFSKDDWREVTQGRNPGRGRREDGGEFGVAAGAEDAVEAFARDVEIESGGAIVLQWT